MSAHRALVIPTEGPVAVVELDGSLAQLQALVGGLIEALPVPSFIPGSDRATCYVGEESKFQECPANMRATDFLVPGIGLFFGDFVAGVMVVAGFRPVTGEHAELPASVERRVRLIEREASA
ncbi:MAG: DUF3846 domain-containing protein [Solirubrobacteraceae bacterium]